MTSEQQFCQAVEEGNREEVARLLKQSPELVHTRDGTGQSAVLVAAYRGHDRVIDLLRDRGAELDVHAAAAVGDVQRIAALLQSMPESVHSRSTDGWTPLHLACYFGRTEAAQCLLDAGADVGAWSENATRNTPLHAALAGVRTAELIERLLDAGADVNAVAEGGVTPLHLAAARGDLALIEALLSRGASRARTDAGQWPEDLATEREHPEAARRLREVGTPS